MNKRLSLKDIQLILCSILYIIHGYHEEVGIWKDTLKFVKLKVYLRLFTYEKAPFNRQPDDVWNLLYCLNKCFFSFDFCLNVGGRF